MPDLLISGSYMSKLPDGLTVTSHYHDILQQAKAVHSASSPIWSTPCGQDGLVRQIWHASNSEIGVVPGGHDVC